MRFSCLACLIVFVPAMAMADTDCKKIMVQLQRESTVYSDIMRELRAGRGSLGDIRGLQDELSLRALRAFAIAHRDATQQRTRLLDLYRDLAELGCGPFDWKGYELTAALFRESTAEEGVELDAARRRADQGREAAP